MIKDIVLKNRSYRRFDETLQLSEDTLLDIIDLARMVPSSKNIQALKFMYSNEPKKNQIIFNSLAWAGYLRNWDGPTEGERPTGYIIILGDKDLYTSFDIDTGIVAQTFLLAATEKGFGGCMIGSMNKKELRETLQIPEKLEICMVVALGIPKEKIVLTEVKNSDIKYWRDENEIHYVPKRKLEDILVK